MATTADQLSGCKITEICSKHSDQASCENDLQCMCKVDDNLANNSLFDAVCLLRECTDGHDRKLFLRNWIESCRHAGKSAMDNIPYDWEPYLPRDDEYIDPTTTNPFTPLPPTSSVKISVVPVSTLSQAIATSLAFTSLSTLGIGTQNTMNSSLTSTSTSSSIIAETTSTRSQPVLVTSNSLSPGAIAGIVAGILLLVAICAGLGYFYWKANKNVKRKNREVAILSDQVSGVGFQRRIDELLAGSNDSTGTILRHKVPGSSEMGAASSSSTMGVVSSSSSVYSVETARAM
ncbi:hypothetical protein N0V94_006291 [Neodidymelliopsis sp. IMI 364377]|nr:hypothetical protein N0V94_006291 [Neodidymelliopsis sp. IMI 364377]